MTLSNSPMTVNGETQGSTSASLLSWLILSCGLALMYVPSFVDLFQGLWSSDEQGHGPIVFGLSVWLFWRKYPELRALPDVGKSWLGFLLVAIAGFMFSLGRSQGILIFEIGSLIWMIAGCLVLLKGTNAIRVAWFCLFFMAFMIPLPGAMVDALTAPMKMAVSYVAEFALYGMGYPIARTGVVLQIGPYQLLVADACAGLHTLFTLEALGLLYLNLVRHASVFRNVTLAILIVPISFCANVIRVMTLTLITYYFGDEAGQGFLHGFSGMVLFMSALLLIIGADSLLRFSAERRT